MSIIGIGEDGISGLSKSACQRIEDAEHIFGGERHLELAADLIKGTNHPWPVPFDSSMKDVLALRGQKVCVLASGDPFFYGVGTTLLRHIDPAETITIPVPSSVSLAASRLGWPLQDTDIVALHGRSLDQVRPLLFDHNRIFALSEGSDTPSRIASLLTENGFRHSRLTVLEALGGAHERIRHTTAESFDLQDIHSLNIVALEIHTETDARIIPLCHGLEDRLFEHDGQITKREIRALTLSALAPRKGELLWDIGAGSGSIAIEWLLADKSLKAIAIEADAGRLERIRHNAASFGVPSLQTIHGNAPDSLQGLSQPDAIFIGGGGSDPDVMDTALHALKPGGRLVANAVTLEMEFLLLNCHKRFGGALSRFEIMRASAIGSMTGWRPAMPITQWIWTKS